MENEELKLTPGQRFIRLLKPDYKEIRNVYVFSAFNGLVSLSLPLGIQTIINLIQGAQVSTSWIIMVVFVVLGVAIMGVMRIFQLKITENLQQRIFARAAFEFTYRIPKIKMDVLYDKYPPELMNRFFDTMTVQKGLSKILIDFSVAGLLVVFSLILLSFYHPFFILFGALLILLVFVIIKFTWKRGLETSLQESKHKYLLVGWLEEVARTLTTFKLAGSTNHHMKKSDFHVKNYLKCRNEHFKVLVNQFSLLVLFKVIITAGLLSIGGLLVIEQQMNIGQFVAAEIIILVVINSVEKLILSLEVIYDVLTALEKIGSVTDLELDKFTANENSIKKDFKHAIRVTTKNINFRYPGYMNNVLNDLNLEINPGERLVLYGKSGSGKSTLLHVLAGLYDIKSGGIAYNGIPRNNINNAFLMDSIGDCFNDDLIFEGSILDNITLGRKDVGFKDVEWAVKNLYLENYIKELDNGYSTIIDIQGKKLPNQIIQKVLLARSIANRPKLLLIEDIFDNIIKSELIDIFKFLLDKQNDWTLAISTSEEYMIRKSDRIAVMDQGKIYKIGSYDEVSSYL